MRRSAVAAVLVWLVAAGAALRPLPALTAAEIREHQPRQALAAAPPVAGGPATVRSGAPVGPEQDARSLAFLGPPTPPQPTAVAAATDVAAAGARALAESLHPQRGPPRPGA